MRTFSAVRKPECTIAFGLHLRKLREKANLSQQELADKSNLPKISIQRIEMKKVNARLETLACIAEGLEIPLSTLLDFKY